jgi:hypothetical protein
VEHYTLNAGGRPPTGEDMRRAARIAAAGLAVVAAVMVMSDE